MVFTVTNLKQRFISIEFKLPKKMNQSSVNELGNPSSIEDEQFLFAMNLATGAVLPMVLRAAIELNLLEVISKAGGKKLCALEIASQIDSKNPNAPEIINRMLRFLSSHSILSCTLITDEHGCPRRLYGLNPASSYLISNEDGVSVANLLYYFNSKFIHECWFNLKDSVLEGESALYRTHGMQLFEVSAKDDGGFNRCMSIHSSMIMEKVLVTYTGFEGLKELMDVGGGIGANLRLVASKYPHIRCINFDLPHVIQNASPCPGVEFVEGDMFQFVPEAETIFMKCILHDWDDSKCIKLVKNCYDALPENGKLIIVESIAPEFPGSDNLSKYVFNFDMCMLAMTPTGKERTKTEFEYLAAKAGFVEATVICRVQCYSVLEFLKRA